MAVVVFSVLTTEDSSRTAEILMGTEKEGAKHPQF